MEKLHIREQSRVLIVVPHQDDEILMTAGVIRRARQKGAEVNVIMATNGDCGCTDYTVGRTRLRETIAGLELLGVDAAHLSVMGYADTGMPAEESFLTHLYEERDRKKIIPSLCSRSTYGLEEKADYHTQKYGQSGGYCRDTFFGDLKELIEEKRPDVIFTTAACDTHGDHSALSAFVVDALREIKWKEQGPELYAGLVHSCEGDESWPKRNEPYFDCPQGLEETSGLRWDKRIRVAVPGEMSPRLGRENLKYRALCCYKTALEPNAYEFLMSFIKEEEIFWRIAWKK